MHIIHTVVTDKCLFGHRFIQLSNPPTFRSFIFKSRDSSKRCRRDFGRGEINRGSNNVGEYVYYEYPEARSTCNMAVDVSVAIKAVCQKYLSYSLKNEQETAILNILNNKHVYCMLPTGYGKSDIYVLPPLILQQVI